ncbi:alpha/beta hydrolase [Carnobacterium gallinarum]|uniref:alpha/beta hydrolase n=1 Tax=Carnobacterium gallinarum TaxID=2749 RepID=UPI00068F9021|nr:alpha/beta hydrolase [Carnobacterium gallinarum]
MQSYQSKIVELVLKGIHFNRNWKLTGIKLKKQVAKKQHKEKSAPPKKIHQQVMVERNELDSCVYYVLTSREKSSQKEIIYFHGGGYIHSITSLHWEFLASLVVRLQCRIIVPMYPLAPKYTYQAVYDFVLPLYQQVIQRVRPENCFLMGDSAGGGISLGLAQLLKERQLPQPKGIVLLSPALDMSLSNEEIDQVAIHDPILATPAVKEIAEWYSGDRGVKDPLISPIYGDFHGLAPISLFTGTYDITNPDAKRLQHQLAKEGIPLEYHEYEKMLHDWVLFPFPESKKALVEICQFIQSEEVR